mgnify:FL=1
MEKGDKIFFQKKIIYLDYVERENKIKNGGVIKWEARGEESRVQIHIRGLYPTDSCRGELMLLSEGEGYPADTIYLQYGTAEYAGIWHNENLAGTGIPYEGCDGIIIKLSETRFLRGIWRKREKQKAETPETVPQNESEPAMLAAAQTAEESMAVVQTMGPVSAAQTVLDAYDDTMLEPQPMPGNEEMRQDEPGVEVLPMPEAEEMPQDAAPAGEIQPDLPPHEPATEVPQPMPETEEPRQDEPGAEEQPEPQQAIPPAEEEAQSHEEESASEAPFLRSQRKMQAGQISPNKWEQLNRIYPKIQPFGDVREYLSIAPCDFVILSEHYQEMVQNSFLLHGYYNYGHLILTKIKEGIDDNYYLGVPGVYYEREKQAALLFGFEGFEGDGDAVQDGSFGYYMKRVEI